MQKINIAMLLLGLALPATAECVPHRVLKIVTVHEPDNETHTLYRLGSRYGRMEAQNDKAHLLFVINEPDIWVLNQTDNTGQHMVDDDEKPEFHAPVIDTESKVWRQLEFGCEEPFMKAVGARVEQLDGGVVQYTHEAEGTSVVLTVAKGKPQRMEVTAPEMKYAIRYVAFEMLDETSADRFTKPEKIGFVEAKQDQ
ncbi:MAG: hypothetical protein DMF56_12565 [Acidobacteria bacterium]|nr:MAG: hypothetical protein DMF56_12565 [Acidobacteriota bacterium]